MKNMTLKEIAMACGGIYYGDDEHYYQEVQSVTTDSRDIQEQCLFIPLRGARVDGHVFIPEVMEQGALCSLSEKRIENAMFPYILVNSTRQALKDIAEHYRKSLAIKVVAITGSVGKTSTKEAIASVLSQKYKVLKTAGNYNNEIGLPLTIFQIRQEHQIAVLELGISQFGEMERLAKIACPDIAVITNIGPCHLENLGNKAGVLKAKTEIFSYMPKDAGIAILNGDDPLLSTIKKANGTLPIFYGHDSSRAVYADEITSLGLEGTSCTIHTPKGDFHVTIPVPGTFMVTNALAATCVGLALELSLEEIQRGILKLQPVGGRNHLIHTAEYTIIDDCYNANPLSMRASLDVLSCANTRTVAILGDMFELGSEEKEMHYQVGRYAAEKGIALLICIGELSKAMAEGAKSLPSPTKVYHFDTLESFLQMKEVLLLSQDTILVKASHGMNFPVILEALQK